MESRSHKGTVEVRANADGAPVIVGYAAVFNRDSSDMGFLEQVDPRAFDKTVREADVRGLGNHDVNWLLGRSKASTLRLSVDSIGLQYEIDVNEADPDGQRALQKVKRGDWDGSSFSFKTIRDEWNWDANPPQRRLLEVGLIDVGPVTFPAYPDATAASRALEPIAKKIGRPVGELVEAMQRGEIRSLIDSRATGDTAVVAWGPEDGFNDLFNDLSAILNPAGNYRFCVIDVSVKLNRALICDWQDNAYWVAPISVAADGEPTISPSPDWTPVEQGWIAANTPERALRVLREARAGKKLSAASLKKIRAAMDSLRELIGADDTDGFDDPTLLDQALESDSIDTAKEEDDLPERSLSVDEMDMELRMYELSARAA